MPDPVIRKRKLSEYRPDPHNANKGTERGQYMIDASVEAVGLARSIVAAADDTIPAGNKTLQAAADAGIEDVLEVETDGTTLVVVKRTDWASVDDEQARQYAYFDNRASEVGLEWDIDRMREDLEAGVDLADLWHEGELEALLAGIEEDTRQTYDMLADIPDTGFDHEAAGQGRTAAFPLAIVLGAADMRRWAAVKEQIGYLDDTRCFMRVLEAWEANNGG